MSFDKLWTSPSGMRRPRPVVQPRTGSGHGPRRKAPVAFRTIDRIGALERLQIVDVARLLTSQERGLLDVHLVEHVEHVWFGKRQTAGTQVGRVIRRLGIHLGEEALLVPAGTAQVGT